jgi:hypothetical protein
MLLIFCPHKKEERPILSSNKYIKFIDLSLKTVQSSRLNLTPVSILNMFILNISFLSLFY